MAIGTHLAMYVNRVSLGLEQTIRGAPARKMPADVVSDEAADTAF